MSSCEQSVLVSTLEVIQMESGGGSGDNKNEDAPSGDNCPGGRAGSSGVGLGFGGSGDGGVDGSNCDNGEGGNNSLGDGNGLTMLNESQELPASGSTSTSSGSAAVGLMQAPEVSPNFYVQQNGHYGSCSQESGISNATTAVVSDTEGHGQIISYGNQPSCNPQLTSNSSFTSTSSSGGKDSVKSPFECLDSSSVATVSTLNSFTTTSSSSGKEDKSLSSTDRSLHVDSTKLIEAIASEEIGEFSMTSSHPAGEMHLQLSQDDMFRPSATKHFTSTPSETIEIFGFSGQPSGALDFESGMGPPAVESVPFLVAGTPSLEAPAVLDSTKGEIAPVEFQNCDNVKKPLLEVAGGPATEPALVDPTNTGSGDANKSGRTPSERATASARLRQLVLNSMKDAELSTISEEQSSQGVVRPDVTGSHSSSKEPADREPSLSIIRRLQFESSSSSGASLPENQNKITTAADKEAPASSLDALSVKTGPALTDLAVNKATTSEAAEDGGCSQALLSEIFNEIDKLKAPASPRQIVSMVNSPPPTVTHDPPLGRLYGVGNKKGGDHASAESRLRKNPFTSQNEGKLTDIFIEKDDNDSPLFSSGEDEEEKEGGKDEQGEMEESQNDDLILHYSPSQRMETQCFDFAEEEAGLSAGGAVETAVEEEQFLPLNNAADSREPQSTFLDDVLVPDSQQSVAEAVMDDALLSGQLKVDDTAKPKSSLKIEDIRFEPISESVQSPLTFHLKKPDVPNSSGTESSSTNHSSGQTEVVAGPSGLHKETKKPFESLSSETGDSAEYNPFAIDEAASRKRNAVDEIDTPACPVGRHKRPAVAVWSRASQTETPNEEEPKAKKVVTQDFGCQVCLAEPIKAPAVEAEHASVKEQAPTSTLETNKLTKDQEVQTVEKGEEDDEQREPEGPKESVDVPDGFTLTRHTMIVTRMLIEEQLRYGKVIKKTVEEIKEEPIVVEFQGDSNDRRSTFLKQSRGKRSPPKASKTPGVSSGSASAARVDAASITSGSSSGAASAPSTSDFQKHISSPEKGHAAAVMNTPALGVATGSGMKTLRSVKRRQCYEIRKSLDLEVASKNGGSSPSKMSSLKLVAIPGSGQRTHGGSESAVKSPAKRKKGNTVPYEIDASPADDLASAACASPRKKQKNKRSNKSLGLPKNSEKPSTSGSKAKSHPPVAESPQTSPDLNTSSSSVKCGPSGLLQPGARIMAKWRDGFYYPGKALEEEKENRWKIMYDDKDVHSIKLSNILVVDILPTGQSIYAQSPDGFYDSGIIVDHYKETETDVGYIVEIDGGAIRRIPQSQVILTHDQAACIEELPVNSMHGYTSISLDNIVEGKRQCRTESPGSSAPSTPRTPRTSGSPRTPKSPRTPRSDASSGQRKRGADALTTVDDAERPLPPEIENTSSASSKTPQKSAKKSKKN